MTEKSIDDFFKDFDIEEYKKIYGTSLRKFGFYFVKEYSNEATYNEKDIVCGYENYIKCIYESLKNENQGNSLSNIEWWKFLTDNGGYYITDDDIRYFLKTVECFVKEHLSCTYKNANALIVSLVNSYLSCLLINSNGSNVNNIATSSIDSMSISKNFNEFCINFPLFNNIFGQKFYTAYKMLIRNNYCNIQVVYSDPYKYRN